MFCSVKYIVKITLNRTEKRIVLSLNHKKNHVVKITSVDRTEQFCAGL